MGLGGVGCKHGSGHVAVNKFGEFVHLVQYQRTRSQNVENWYTDNHYLLFLVAGVGMTSSLDVSDN